MADTTRVLPSKIVQQARKPINVSKEWAKRISNILLIVAAVTFTTLFVISWIFSGNSETDSDSLKESSNTAVIQPLQNKTKTRQDVAAAVTDVKSVKVTAPVGRWSERISVPCGHDCVADNDPAYGLSNLQIPLAIRVNGNDNIVLKEKKLDDGSIANVIRPEIVADFVEIRSIGSKDAYAVVKFIRK
jgi:hypothetical protein